MSNSNPPTSKIGAKIKAPQGVKRDPPPPSTALQDSLFKITSWPFWVNIEGFILTLIHIRG